MSIDFTGQVVIVTGAGRGLGRAYALAFAARGARVVVNDRGGSVSGEGDAEDVARSVVDEIRRARGNALDDAHDVGSADGANALVARAMHEFGRVDVLVHNAGILRDRSFMNLEAPDWDAVIGVHLTGAYLLARAVWPHMRAQRGGRIVLTSSASGLYGNFGQANYAAAKLGVVGLMHVLRIEGEKYGIRVNTVAPVAVSRMGTGIFPDAVAALIPVDDVVPVVLFLSSESSTASGHVITAGGGRFARAQVVEGAGVTFPSHRAGTLTPEQIAERYDEIADLRDARPFATGGDAIQFVVEALQRKNAT